METEWVEDGARKWAGAVDLRMDKCGEERLWSMAVGKSTVEEMLATTSMHISF